MAVTFDAVGTGKDPGAGVASPQTLTTLTVGALTNRAIVAQIAWVTTPPAGLTVKWDSAGTPQSLTQIISHAGVNGQTVQLWGLVAPTSGNKTLQIAWTSGTTELMYNAASWSGVDQTGGATSFPNSTFATGNNANATVGVTSATGNAVMSVTAAGTLQAINSVSATQTMLLHGIGNLEGGGSRAAGAATVTVTGTYAGTDQWVIIGTDILTFNAAVKPTGPFVTSRPDLP
jgi:hypothetical protein